MCIRDRLLRDPLQLLAALARLGAAGRQVYVDLLQLAHQRVSLLLELLALSLQLLDPAPQGIRLAAGIFRFLLLLIQLLFQLVQADCRFHLVVLGMVNRLAVDPLDIYDILLLYRQAGFSMGHHLSLIHIYRIPSEKEIRFFAFMRGLPAAA